MKDNIRRRIGAALLAGIMMVLSAVMAQEQIKLNGVDVCALEEFQAAHPEICLIDDQYTDYQTTDELLRNLQQGAFDKDIFVMNNACVDYQAVMRAGHCMSLSESPVLREAMARMHPFFAAQCMVDGKIYAIPHTFQPNYIAFSARALEHIGWDNRSLPATFPAFLDFLEQWLAYLKENPASDVTLLGKSLLDETSYHRHSYTAFLVDRLLENAMLQKQAAGLEENELIPLLERCFSIGQELYLYDQGLEDPYALLESIQTTLFDGYSFLSLRLEESQPHLIPVYVNLYVVSAETENPSACLTLMEELWQNNWPMYQTYFCRDAQPLLNPEYDMELTRMQQLIEATQSQLGQSCLSEADRQTLALRLEGQLCSQQKLLTEEKYRYLVTAGDLARHEVYTDYYIAAMPGIFHAGDAETFRAYRALKEQFSRGEISAEMLVRGLQELAGVAR